MIPALGADKILIGNDAGYLLAFHEEQGQKVEEKPVLEIGRDDYHAEIRASLPSGLGGGVYEFVVEGLTDEHYKQIAQRPDNKVKVVRLYLLWHDANASVGGYLANLAGLTDTLSKLKAADIPQALVADLRITGVTRKAGARRYETTITARERIYDLLATSRLCGDQAIENQPLDQAVQQLLERTAKLQKDRTYKVYGLSPKDKKTFEKGRTAAELLQALGKRLEESTQKYGRGMFLIRGGVLHIGTRPIPLTGDDKDPVKLTLASGLLETEALAPVISDPNFDPCKGEQPKRRQFRLTLKGRADLKPGDMVEFDSPPEDVSKTGGGLLGAVGDLIGSALIPALGDLDFKNPVKLYVHTVEHKLGRTSGFATTLTGVEITGSAPDDRWDKHTPESKSTAPAPQADASPEAAAAQAMKQLAGRAMGSMQLPEVGEVRAVTSSGTADPPGQTERVWSGLAPGDGGAFQARRLAVRRPSPSPMIGVPYLSPFAWGKTGLVLPRYPGTRVLLAHRNGAADDPIDVGALWESAHGPDSEAGDWWLILPVGIAPAERGTLADDKIPQEHTGKVSQDLIDGDGNRVIEVGELTVRVTRNKLKNAGERPARGADSDAITIEHADGQASIVIKSDGSIVLKGKNIELDAGSGNITLKASKVDVS